MLERVTLPFTSTLKGAAFVLRLLEWTLQFNSLLQAPGHSLSCTVARCSISLALKTNGTKCSEHVIPDLMIQEHLMMPPSSAHI